MHRIRMLKHYGVEPYVVFDGDYLPSKLSTEDFRAAKRAEHLAAGMLYHSQKQSTKAMEQFQRCVDITPEMAYRFILALRKEDIAYVVAPYEADAQLAYLEKKGTIQAIVTEDSDLLVFGCKTLLLKMSQFGDCVEIKREKFANVTGQITLHGFTDDDFRHMAILSGCDYLANINGVGLIKAHRLLRKFNKNMHRVVQALRMQVGIRVPPDYLDLFHRANLTFKHQRVFCPEKECLVMWNEPEAALSDEILVYIGADLDIEVARGVARGELHPMTKAAFKLEYNEKENFVASNSLAPYKPKAPTPPKSIRSFFSPKRSRSLQDITSVVNSKNQDAERANAELSTPNTHAKSQSAMKRSFTALATSERETISVKRARHYLSIDRQVGATASPFFSKTRHDDIAHDEDMILEETFDIADAAEETVDADDAIDMTENGDDNLRTNDLTEEIQVLESPPRSKPEETAHMSDEVIPDSPSDILRTHSRENFEQDASNRNPNEDAVRTNPEKKHSKMNDIYPLSPPPSNLPIRILPREPKRTPILRPGMNKPYTPHSSRKPFPDTPTPVLSTNHASIVQSWKDRFNHTTSIPASSNRPMRPLHTPIFQRSSYTATVARPKTAVGTSKLVVEHSESRPSERSVCLDRFRFTPS